LEGWRTVRARASKCTCRRTSAHEEKFHDAGSTRFRLYFPSDVQDGRAKGSITHPDCRDAFNYLCFGTRKRRGVVGQRTLRVHSEVWLVGSDGPIRNTCRGESCARAEPGAYQHLRQHDLRTLVLHFVIQLWVRMNVILRRQRATISALAQLKASKIA
jgi:hypothetical protein